MRNSQFIIVENTFLELEFDRRGDLLWSPRQLFLFPKYAVRRFTLVANIKTDPPSLPR